MSQEIVVSAKGVAQDDEVYVYVRWSLVHPEGCKGFVLLALVDGGPQMVCETLVVVFPSDVGDPWTSEPRPCLFVCVWNRRWSAFRVTWV